MTATIEAYVGRSIPRVEDLRLLTGGGRYGADFDRPGQLHARLVRSQVGHGRIRAIDVETAAARPGVVAVFTAADLPDVRIPIRLFATEHANKVLQPPLAREAVRYVGDPVAVVVAEDPYLAEDAADDVIVEIEPLEVVLDPRLAADESSPPIHPAIGTNAVDRVQISHGKNIDRLFERAAVVLRRQFSVQRHGAVPLEPRCLIAEYDAGGAALTVWGAAKVKHFNRRILATLLDVAPESIRCIEGDVGGGFGARGEFYPEDYLIPWLAIELGRPVKWVEDRRENLVALNHSREQAVGRRVRSDERRTVDRVPRHRLVQPGRVRADARHRAAAVVDAQPHSRPVPVAGVRGRSGVGPEQQDSRRDIPGPRAVRADVRARADG